MRRYCLVSNLFYIILREKNSQNSKGDMAHISKPVCHSERERRILCANQVPDFKLANYLFYKILHYVHNDRNGELINPLSVSSPTIYREN
jgi:hypothetical protein